MSEVVYQKGESRIEVQKYTTIDKQTALVIGITFIAVLTGFLWVTQDLLSVMLSHAYLSETYATGCLLVGGELLVALATSFIAGLAVSWNAPPIPVISISSPTRSTPIKIPLSPTSQNPCEEPEFKAAYTKAINEMKAEIDKIEAERAEKNARRNACVASLKEMAK